LSNQIVQQPVEELLRFL